MVRGTWQKTLVYHLLLYYIPTVVVLGLIGNMVSISVFLRTRLRRRSSSFFLAAMAGSDSASLVLLAARWLFNNSYLPSLALTVLDSDVGCKIINYVGSTVTSIGVWLTVAYTLERCVAVQFPLRRRSMCTVGRAKTTIMGIVMFSAASYLYIPFIYGHSNKFVGCGIYTEYQDVLVTFSVAEMTIMFFLPFLVTAALNAIILYCLCTRGGPTNRGRKRMSRPSTFPLPSLPRDPKHASPFLHLPSCPSSSFTSTTPLPSTSICCAFTSTSIPLFCSSSSLHPPLTYRSSPSFSSHPPPSASSLTIPQLPTTSSSSSSKCSKNLANLKTSIAKSKELCNNNNTPVILPKTCVYNDTNRPSKITVDGGGTARRGTANKRSTSSLPDVKCIMASCKDKHSEEVFTHIAKSTSCGTIFEEDHSNHLTTSQATCANCVGVRGWPNHSSFSPISLCHQLGSHKTRKQESNTCNVNAYDNDAKKHKYGSNSRHSRYSNHKNHCCTENKPGVGGFSGLVYVKNHIDIRKLTRNHKALDKSFVRQKVTYKSHSLMILRTPKCIRNHSQVINARCECRCVTALFRHHSYTFTNKNNKDEHHQYHRNNSYTFTNHKNNKGDRDCYKRNQNHSKDDREQDHFHRNLNHSNEDERDRDDHDGSSDSDQPTTASIGTCTAEDPGPSKMNQSSPLASITVSPLRDEGLSHHHSVYCQSTPSRSCRLSNLTIPPSSPSARSQAGSGINIQGDQDLHQPDYHLTERNPTKDINPAVNRKRSETRDCAHANFTKMLILISTTFLIMHLPSRALRLYVMVHFRSESPGSITKKEKNTLLLLQHVFLCLHYAHSAVNFLLYVLCGSNFRRSLHQLVSSQVKHIAELGRRWWGMGRGVGGSSGVAGV
ncbi:hypothetical protein Pmani_033229 [Petrolisthes manimaculis]|uniref:G-protein coupled receptors family 1 profile domain-containing protein n=1 Tax=Petrolisthes manimaculis TaxID=1843537 RepID=A0AAE1NRG4_9EUCA|nr:hypothetical protein Pmani_033229 [Petrolisthes manimaculis]